MSVCALRYSHDLKLSLKVPKQKSDRYVLNFDEAKGWLVNRDHEYYHQMMAQLYFTNKELAYFFVWTPHTYQIFKFSRDPHWEYNIDRLINFYVDKFVPFVLANPDLI